MHDSKHLKSRHRHRHREPPQQPRRHWCCSFTVPPLSPDNPPLSNSHASSSCNKKAEISSSFSSPPTQKPTPLARRILSPGRVSPISDHPVTTQSIPQKQALPKSPLSPATIDSEITAAEGSFGVFDARLSLKGKNGGSLVLELASEVLTANSLVFSDLVADHCKNKSGLCRIQVPDVENLDVFRETIELMFEEDISKKLLKIGVFRAIDILEVSAGIKFYRGVSSCLNYIEAVPWTEEEEKKLRDLFGKIKIDDAKTVDILDRLLTNLNDNAIDAQQTLTKQLIWSVTTGTDANAKNELKSLVKGLLCKSLVNGQNHPDVNKEDVLAASHSCLGSLTCLLEEAFGADTCQKDVKRGNDDKPLVERISTQVDNLNWLLEILLGRQIAEDFVGVWADQEKLLELHGKASPMVRYEVSRVSAIIFIAMSCGRLHCPLDMRLRVVQKWFGPMLCDFGWLRRCKKGLDTRALEEAMGQALLTLPLKEQYELFMEWFGCFSRHGTECPNLSKAFQIWWRRSFLRGSKCR
ncbi:BTB/POZ domain-containing protein [Striga hermonthica]|uniref:BTB/POZ domain-containing protein n=1 Tax=Striga hermonthica TaxID=68872 RepID=A0A9N7NNP5_STRHE|nr:BTB/POZ domain-containing protein [Striga hermonthica]